MTRSDSVFSFSHGDHTCLFYYDLASLLQMLTPYIAEGLRKNERCFCAQRPENLQALCNDLRFLGVDIERETKRGALELHTTNEVYFPNSRFEPGILMDLLERSIQKAVRDGFAGFRTAGDLSWAVEGRDECDRLIGYERLVQASYPQKPAVGLCQYPIQSFRPEALERVVEAHSKVLDNGVPGSACASLRIRNHKYEAEIVSDKATQRAYQYVVQFDDGERLWGQTADFDAAMRAVEIAAQAGSPKAAPLRSSSLGA